MGDKIIDRRDFLKFLGRSAALTAAGPLLASHFLSACSTSRPRVRTAPLGPHTRANLWPFAAIQPSTKDELIIPSNFNSHVILKSGDTIGPGLSVGSDCDYTAFIPLNPGNLDDALLWVNHEDMNPLFISKRTVSPGEKRKPAEVAREQDEVGGTLVRIRRDQKTRQWSPVVGDPLNRRFSAKTPIPFAGGHSIAGKAMAQGTLANCSGGMTPWGTILSCEENFDHFYGDRSYSRHGSTGKISTAACLYGWETVESRPPEHYGWVVEIDPRSGSARKLTSLGRFGHEAATVTQGRGKRCVVYMGDDQPDRCIYKFIADRPGTLDHGTLYVAQLETGRWIPLDWHQQPKLKSWFANPMDVLIYTREAALLVGGTPLHRPEDIEVDPLNRSILVALTNHAKKGDFFGSILKIEEKDSNPLALEFSHSTFLTGGPATGFACPDNLVFDPAGDLWFTCDVTGSKLYQKPYEPFGNNALFCVPMDGPDSGKPFRFASSPVAAEFTGPCFTPDGETLFISVQHPGETSKNYASLTSHWPQGENSLPLSAVVAIQ